MKTLAILLPLLFAACATPEGVLSTYMAIPVTCEGKYDEMHDNASRIARVNNLRQIKTYGIFGVTIAVIAGAVSPYGVAIAALPFIEEFQINTAGNHTRIKHLANARLEQEC